MFNFFTQLPNSVKLITGFFILGFFLVILIGTGVLSISDLLSISENTNNTSLVSVEILVQTDDNQSIENAEVQFISQGSPVTKYTTSSGYTEIEIPLRESIEVNISKDGYKNLREIIDLKKDPNRNRQFKLQRKDSFSFTGIDIASYLHYQYYTSEYEFMPFLLSSLNPDLNISIISEILKDLNIEKTPFVVKNAVFQTIEKFKLESGHSFDISEEFNPEWRSSLGIRKENDQHSSSTLISSKDGIASKSPGGEFLDNFLLQRTTRHIGGYFSYAPVSAPVRTNIEDAQYTSFIKTKIEESEVSANIIQFPTLFDISERLQTDKDTYLESIWIKKIIKENPNIRGFLGFSYDFIFDLENQPPGICKTTWKIENITPMPYLKFLDITNNGEISLKIESIDYKSTNENAYKITPADQRDQLFISSSTITENLNIFLKPGDHFLIPIEFGFSTKSDKLVYREKMYNAENPLEDITAFNSQPIYVRKPLTEFEREKISQVSEREINKIYMDSVIFSDDFLSNRSYFEDLLELIPNRFAIGSIFNVDSFNINGQTISINPPNNEPVVYISEIFGGGSCPYLLIYDSDNDIWIDLGTVLKARGNKNSQHEEIHGLFDKISKLKIEEREPEITYIDSISLLYKEPGIDTDQEILYPLEKLEKSDNNYLVLHQGDSLEFDFGDLIPNNAFDLRLKIDGYYDVLENTLF